MKQNPALLKGDGDKITVSKVILDENVAHEDKKEQRRKKAAGWFASGDKRCIISLMDQLVVCGINLRQI